MDTWMYLAQGFAVALTPENLLIALIGCFVGTVVGLLPGLGPINGVAILLPLAFALKLPPESALILLATVYIGCEYGGRISSILLNVPGDAAAIMTALDGYPMAKQGRAGVALSISAVSSFVGSLLAIGGIILFAPALACWSLAFGPAEYFALMVFAIACLGSMMSQNPLKSFLAALIGLGLATVGVDANTGVYRFTFDSVHLSDGIQFIVVVIGLFSVSEILLMLEHTKGGQQLVLPDRSPAVQLPRADPVHRHHAALGHRRLLRRYPAGGRRHHRQRPHLYDREAPGRPARHLRPGRYPRRGGPRGGQQRLRLWLLHPHADPGCAGFGHHGGDDGGPDPL
ncbi:tripartite tricarboxylate transporter TctA [Aeromonas schubertii]|uniref:Tripartite tricarboxylate transporter TctA n=1 Tax=Aeromonas schubertii TaxID=652 RepID=A0A0S2SEE8_9GAMM|nr:tripartite tricarboxylate transporter TctA [Aeromonas schubertii]